MRELGYEAISGGPGTSASLAVTAVTSPTAYPRLSAVAPLNTPIHYTIEDSTGMVLSEGIGYSTAAGAFTRVREYSHWTGTTYTETPGSLISIPSGCVIYCGAGGSMFVPTLPPPCSIDSNRWFEPGGKAADSNGFAGSATNEYYWQFSNLVPTKVDAVGLYLSAAGTTFDLGIYDIDASNGQPGILLVGWQNQTSVSASNILTLASATLGIYAGAASARLPIAHLFGSLCGNVTSVKSVPHAGTSVGSNSPELTNHRALLYRARTPGTSFASTPTISGRFAASITSVPALAFRGV